MCRIQFFGTSFNFLVVGLARSLLCSYFACGILVFRESEGTFQFGQYWREVDDLRAVIQHFSRTNHTVSAIIGHSKGALVLADDQYVKFHFNNIEGKQV